MSISKALLKRFKRDKLDFLRRFIIFFMKLGSTTHYTPKNSQNNKLRRVNLL